MGLQEGKWEHRDRKQRHSHHQGPAAGMGTPSTEPRIPPSPPCPAVASRYSGNKAQGLGAEQLLSIQLHSLLSLPGKGERWDGTRMVIQHSPSKPQTTGTGHDTADDAPVPTTACRAVTFTLSLCPSGQQRQEVPRLQPTPPPAPSPHRVFWGATELPFSHPDGVKAVWV